jgi:hypothetical protein
MVFQCQMCAWLGRALRISPRSHNAETLALAIDLWNVSAPPVRVS